MKKTMILCAGLCLAMAFASCGGSKESAYKKAYEKAKAQEAQQATSTETEAPVVTPLEEKPATETTVVDNTDNVAVKSEAVTVVEGNGLKNFSVVVGSFSSKANALGLQQRLKNQGHAAQVAYNSSINFYRVIVATFDSKADAVSSRNSFRSQYPDAWLLFKK